MKKLIILGLLFSTMAMGREIIFSNKINPDHLKKLQNDLRVVKNMEFANKTPARTLKALGIPELNSETAHQWLTTRVGYIIEDQSVERLRELLKKEVINIEEENFVYSPYRPKLIPQSIDGTSKQAKGVIIMSNLGTALYRWGKSSQYLLNFNMEPVNSKKKMDITIKSPRVGIIQIGEGLFAKDRNVNTKNAGAISNSIARLGTIFHEARHSDGHLKSLGFYHSICPAKHELAGLPACDENLNGSYTVGAVMLTEMLKACGDQCSATEKEVLKTLILDSYGRVQKTTTLGTPSTDLDARPEFIL
jgi:hypothetical protein